MLETISLKTIQLSKSKMFMCHFDTNGSLETVSLMALPFIWLLSITAVMSDRVK